MVWLIAARLKNKLIGWCSSLKFGSGFPELVGTCMVGMRSMVLYG